MLKAISYTTIAFILSFTPIAQADESTKNNALEKINKFLNYIREEFNIKSGISIAIVKDQAIVYEHNSGYANIESSQAINNNTVYYIASITKPLFALTLLNALQNSKLTLHSNLNDLFPEIYFPDNVQASEITIKHLLNHTSGLNDHNMQAALAISGTYNSTSLMKMLSLLQPSKNMYQNKFEYTNLGYNILSLLFSNALNTPFLQPWQEALNQTIFIPFDMSHSSAYMSSVKKNNWGLAQPYSFFSHNKNHSLYLQKKDNTMHAAGGVVSTAQDLANFLIVQLNQGELYGKQVYPKNLIHLSQKKTISLSEKKGDFIRTGYALGWYIGDYKDIRTYHHFGSFDGYRPHLSFMPEKKLGVVILNNEGMLNDQLTDLIADFTYSVLLNEQSVESRLKARVKALKNKAMAYQGRWLEKEAFYQSLSWNLSAHKQAYLGRYTHPLMGVFTVSQNTKSQYILDWGNVHSIATASKVLNTMRVKLRPSRAQIVHFQVKGNQVVALTYDNIKFSKNTLHASKSVSVGL